MNTPMRPVTHRLTGREDQVVNVLTAAHARGHLLDYRSPQRLDVDHVAITVTLLQPSTTPQPTTPRRTDRVRPRLMLAVKVLAGLVAAAGLVAVGWGVWLLLQWIHAHQWLLLGGLALVLVVTGAASGLTTTYQSGRGCRHR